MSLVRHYFILYYSHIFNGFKDIMIVIHFFFVFESSCKMSTTKQWLTLILCFINRLQYVNHKMLNEESVYID